MKFDELNKRAKERAREWYRSHVFSDSNDWESVLDDAVECAHRLGLSLDTSHIYFSGFSSQGYGACFDGTYFYCKGAGQAIAEYAPRDAELQRIADQLEAVQFANDFGITATCTHAGRGNHSRCMRVDVLPDELGDADDDIAQLLRDFADWIYKQLEAEYEYQCSDEAVDEAITVSEYDFDEDGRRT